MLFLRGDGVNVYKYNGSSREKGAWFLGERCLVTARKVRPFLVCEYSCKHVGSMVVLWWFYASFM